MYFPLILSGILLAILGHRLFYILYMRYNWQEVCIKYIVENKENPENIVKYVETWPIYQMVLSMHVRNFAVFIVNKKEMYKILDFFSDSAKVEE